MGADYSDFINLTPVWLTQIERCIFFLHVVVQVGGPQSVDGSGPHAHEYLGTDEQRHIQVVLVSLLVAWARRHVEQLAPAAVAALTETFVASWRVHLLDLVGWRDEMWQRKQRRSHSNHNATHSQPAWPLTSAPEVRDEDDHKQAANVKTTDQQARLWAAQTVALLDGGDDAAQVAWNHQGLNKG